MGSRISLRNKNYSAREELVVEYRVCTECNINSCEDCGIYKQLTEDPSKSYGALLTKVMSEEITKLLKTMIIIAVSFLASLINFSRLADFKEEQLYLETILSVLLYYLVTSKFSGAAAVLVGGSFHWFTAFSMNIKYLTPITMTFLQVGNNSIRHYEWVIAAEHMFLSCIPIHIWEVLQTHYVNIMIYCIAIAYLYYVYKFGVGIEDFLVFTIVLFANHYTVTGNLKHCCLKENITCLIFWIGAKEARDTFQYFGLGFRPWVL